MKKRYKKALHTLLAGMLAIGLLAPGAVIPARAEASGVKTAAEGLAALAALGKLIDYVNANYYKYAKPVGEIEKQYTPLGPYKVANLKKKVRDREWKAYEVFYPENIGTLEGRLPVVLMANGTGTPVSKYREVLRHLASWGFIVGGNEEDNSRSGEGVIATLHYIEACDEDPESPLKGHVDRENIGVAGHSQGGVGAIHAATNFPESRQFRAIFTASATSLFWADDGPLGKEWGYDVSGLETPIFMTAGTGAWDAGKTDDPQAKEGQGIAPLWSLKKTFGTIPDSTPKVVARRTGKDHGDMLRAADAYMTAWFVYYLKHDEGAGRAFFGTDSELDTNPEYQDVMISDGEA